MANPNGIGGFKKGQTGNPGGRTAEEIRAAKLLNDELRKPDLIRKGVEAYKALLEDKNPAIVKDFMDRIGGKAADRIELSSASALEGKSDKEFAEEVGRALKERPSDLAAFLRGAGLGSLVPKVRDQER